MIFPDLVAITINTGHKVGEFIPDGTSVHH